MIGETTPRTFYDSLTEGMMEDGFLSRFLIIEYVGDRPRTNPNQVLIPDAALVDVIRNLAYAAEQCNMGRQDSIAVGRTEEAAQIMNKFELECDFEINKTTDESYRQMWNRAALKALRISALLAVADHYLQPRVQAHHINWAIDIIRRDIAIMQRRLETGDVGMSDTTRERKMGTIIKNYVTRPLSNSMNFCEKLRANGIIPRSYLQTYCAQASSFFNFRGGSTRALDLVIQSFIDNGYLKEADKVKLALNFQFHGKAYQIVQIPEFAQVDS
jgi:hypothetical protein